MLKQRRRSPVSRSHADDSARGAVVVDASRNAEGSSQGGANGSVSERDKRFADWYKKHKWRIWIPVIVLAAVAVVLTVVAELLLLDRVFRPPLTRLGGDDRYMTSQLVARSWGATDKVVVAESPLGPNSDSDLARLADAAVHAQHLQAPLILHPPFDGAARLDRDARRAINDLGASAVCL